MELWRSEKINKTIEDKELLAKQIVNKGGESSMTNKISPDDFPGNSHVKKNDVLPFEPDDSVDETHTKSVVKGAIRRSKKSPGKIFSETFLGEDARSVMSYIIWEVLIPAAKSTVSDMVSGGIEMLLFGGQQSSGNRNRQSRLGPSRSTVSYGDYYNRGASYSQRKTAGIQRQGIKDNIVFDNRSDAEEVVGCMLDLISQYGEASVADFYDLVGVESAYSDYKYGWDSLPSVSIGRLHGGGYIINLPRPVQLN